VTAAPPPARPGAGNVAPRKDLGQHFLVDDNILLVIERLAGLAVDDVVLEVGPGLGVLTRFLAARVAYVHAVEVDRRLEPELRELPRTTVHWGDALRLDVAALDPPPRKLVSNLPYNVATPLVVESLALPQLETWCVMVQREVADRFFASPSTKAYGAVSVLVQLATERTGFHPVSREVFRPRPNVDSALVAFRRVAAGAPPALKRLVEAAFGHRRKTLANALALAGLASRQQAVAALAAIGQDPAVRAEALAPPEFVALEDALEGRA
jgi:16S rRNA (adenine1518-N6/adenine1519-N6)-dimethyltransferase